ncbi:hypothetical protein FNF27_03817 [Cafeteria roenbergensis]|uniref:Dihydropteridine reductase n=1 Tax=Cafeteria roenbergensis TaxID=33653 RepID=A0A5A8EBX1_CAFRO|nr:hypothetical protein FNF27_03817 [Cafeteria roenbergensis]
MLARGAVRMMSTEASARVVLVVGGSGALGRACVSAFKAADWTVVSADRVEDKEADHSVVVDGAWDSHVEQLAAPAAKLGNYSAVICTAGGWAGGSLSEPEDAVAGAQSMIEACYQTALSSALVSYKCMRPDGLLALTGAAAALGPTPGMIGYGMAKAATAFLSSCAAAPNAEGGLPDAAHVTLIAPNVLDSPANRANMPDADFGTFTPPAVVADLLLSRAEGGDGRAGAARGEILEPRTAEGVTTWHRR